MEYNKSREILRDFYAQNGILKYFERDNTYLESAFHEINEMWSRNQMCIRDSGRRCLRTSPTGRDRPAGEWRSRCPAASRRISGALRESSRSVSYTHLDVYKRQPCDQVGTGPGEASASGCGLHRGHLSGDGRHTDTKRTSAEFRQTVVMITHNDDIARLAC